MGEQDQKRTDEERTKRKVGNKNKWWQKTFKEENIRNVQKLKEKNTKQHRRVSSVAEQTRAQLRIWLEKTTVTSSCVMQQKNKRVYHEQYLKKLSFAARSLMHPLTALVESTSHWEKGTLCLRVPITWEGLLKLFSFVATSLSRNTAQSSSAQVTGAQPSASVTDTAAYLPLVAHISHYLALPNSLLGLISKKLL